MIEMITYIKLHILSLEQDMEKYYSEDDVGYIEINAALDTSRHLLSVAEGMFSKNDGLKLLATLVVDISKIIFSVGWFCVLVILFMEAAGWI